MCSFSFRPRQYSRVVGIRAVTCPCIDQLLTHRPFTKRLYLCSSASPLFLYFYHPSPSPLSPLFSLAVVWPEVATAIEFPVWLCWRNPPWRCRSKTFFISLSSVSCSFEHRLPTALSSFVFLCVILKVTRSAVEDVALETGSTECWNLAWHQTEFCNTVVVRWRYCSFPWRMSVAPIFMFLCCNTPQFACYLNLWKSFYFQNTVFVMNLIRRDKTTKILIFWVIVL